MPNNDKPAPLPIGPKITSRECIIEVRPKNQLGATHVAVWENDWTRAGDEQWSRHKEGEDHASGFSRETFEHSQGVEVGEYQRDDSYSKFYVQEQARHLVEQAQAKENVFEVKSNVLSLMAGGRFALEDAPDKEFVCSSALQVGTFPKFWQLPEAGVGVKDDGFQNSFECLPLDVPYRLDPVDLEVERPHAHGVHLARVVGPSSQEMLTDIYGRVRIRFHWDRKSERLDSKRMCWARVSQAWAGQGYGTMFIPRIGMEVLVQFIEGDPDRPVIVGCVYDNQNRPPLQLAADQSKSIIRTQSTPREKGKPLGYNSIEFDDQDGSEYFNLHAQKDMTKVVEHDHRVQVKNDETLTIEKNQTLTVGTDGSGCLRKKTVNGNEVIEVSGERETTVTKNDTQTFKAEHQLNVTKKVTETFEDEYSLTVTKKVTQTFDDESELTVAKKATQKFQDDKTEIVQGGFDLTTNKKFVLTQGNTTLGFSENKVNLDAGGAITITQGSVTVTVKDGAVNIKASDGVTIERGGSKIRLDSSSVAIKGSSKVTIG